MNKIRNLLLCVSLFTIFLHAQVTNVGTHRISITIDEHTLQIPCYRNLPLDQPDGDITRAVVVIHGTNRDADEYYDAVLNAAADVLDSTIIIAPQFLTEIDLNAHTLDSTHLYWSSSGWKSGSNSLDDSTSPRPVRASSYTMIDTVLTRLAESWTGLRTIVIAGHSAGGQFVNRYMACSPVISDLCENSNLPVRGIVANPSSYLYMNNERPVDGTVDQFEVPVTACTYYNEYKYGLDDLYTYPAASGSTQICEWYGERNIVYLLGGDDNDPNDPYLDTTCYAMLQGDHRLERGTIYYNHLLDCFGAGITENHLIDTVPGVGHSKTGMFNSEKGKQYLFEYLTVCTSTMIKNTASPIQTGGKLFPNPVSNTLRYSALGFNAALAVVYDIAGREITRISLKEKNAFGIDLSGQPAGVYYLKVSDHNGHELSIDRFIKIQ